MHLPYKPDLGLFPEPKERQKERINTTKLFSDFYKHDVAYMPCPGCMSMCTDSYTQQWSKNKITMLHNSHMWYHIVNVPLPKGRNEGISRNNWTKERWKLSRKTATPAAPCLASGLVKEFSRDQRAWGMPPLELCCLQHTQSLSWTCLTCVCSFPQQTSWGRHFNLGFPLTASHSAPPPQSHPATLPNLSSLLELWYRLPLPPLSYIIISMKAVPHRWYHQVLQPVLLEQQLPRLLS